MTRTTFLRDWPENIYIKLLDEEQEKIRPFYLRIYRKLKQAKPTGLFGAIIPVIPDTAGEPSYDQAELETLIDKGTKAWADVPDSAGWVREQRNM